MDRNFFQGPIGFHDRCVLIREPLKPGRDLTKGEEKRVIENQKRTVGRNGLTDSGNPNFLDFSGKKMNASIYLRSDLRAKLKENGSVTCRQNPGPIFHPLIAPWG
jgi:hypothetical protein